MNLRGTTRGGLGAWLKPQSPLPTPQFKLKKATWGDKISAISTPLELVQHPWNNFFRFGTKKRKEKGSSKILEES